MLKKIFGSFIFIMLCLWVCGTSRADLPTYTLHTEFVGSYSLPVKHELSQYAEWKLPELKWFRNNEAVKVTYRLPDLLLDDSDQEIEMAGKKRLNNPFFQLNGPAAQAVCTELQTDQFVCLVRFQKQKLKFKSDADFFNKRFQNSDEGRHRYEVAQAFSVEPIGILRIEKR